jgi:amino acid adenylation domain-containing protein/thioester reductase-like protein
MMIMDNPGNIIENAFVVAVNDRGQHALWQASIDLPAGWQRQSAAMSRQACLDAIAAAWPDITPAGTCGSAGSGSGEGYPHGHQARFVHERFAEQASRRPDAAAVIARGSRLTYRELDQSANRLAHYLKDMGGGPQTLIGVHADRGVEAVRSLLAIMKAGRGYLPLDPSLPPARLAQICAEAGPAAILTDRSAKNSFLTETRVLAVGDLAADLGRRPGTAPEVSLDPGHLCYVIHTSGSTGTPKAVAVSHGSLACVITELAREYRISARDRVVQLASLAFDTSIEQMMVALAYGATLILPPPRTIGPTDLLRYLEGKRVSVIDLTPAYWHQVLAITEPDDRRLRSLRLMITGGEMAEPADCQAAMRAAPAARLLNAYGLTETTITSALFDAGGIAEGPTIPSATVPVGRPIGHTRIMVLDEKLRPVPARDAGEIYVGGCGVALGYLGQPMLTAEMFLPDGSGVPGSRMYRTGDLGRWRPDGNLEITGRVDRQLKVSGFRVEPGEIESVLAEHPDIGQVAVVATEQGPGRTRLAAYYTLCYPGGDDDPQASTAEGESSPPYPRDLRRYLRARLPGYMIPAVFVPLDRMPLTLEGEPARGTLESPRVPAQRDDREEQHTPTQAGLSHLWSELLKKEQVSLDDDFFALGGNSLLAAEMLAHARVMFGIRADHIGPLTRCLLRDPTLRGFARAAQDARAGKLATDGDRTRVDFAREAELRVPGRLDAAPRSPRSPRPHWRKPPEILLTGSTGFLGTHLLRELLAATTARVWCLVRADDAAHGMVRIADAAARHGLPGLPADRVIPLPGDLAALRLGLSPGEFRELTRSIDIIYHAGAMVNFIYPYEELRAANVTGTREVIRLACLAGGIPVHYVSTTAVLAGLGVMGVREVTEGTPLAHADRLRVGYVETKFVAEELLRNAGRAGLPVAIYRPLDIVGSRRTGVWNTATEMCAMVRFITDTGLAPGIDLPLDFVPADTCAAAIRYISALEGATGRTYHLASRERAPLGALVDRLREHGFSISEVPFATWVSELLRYAARHPAHPMTPFLPLFIDRDRESGLTPAEMYLGHVFPHYTRSNTESALRGSGIAFPPVDGPLLDSNIGHLIATGYLTASRGNGTPAQRGRSRVPGRSAHAG